METPNAPVLSGSVKELFPEFFLDDQEPNNRIWNRGVIVFDANVLLNLYELSSETASKYLAAMATCQDRIWLPNWVVYEFLVQREEIIERQVLSYDKLKNVVTNAINPLKIEDKHPYVGKKELEDIIKKVEEITNAIEESKKAYERSCSYEHDDKLEKLLSIISSKVGHPYTNERLLEIQEDANKRMPDQIPPGYVDFKEKEGLDKASDFTKKCGRYGDYIIWKQIIDYSITAKVDIIFITNDVKPDWCDNKKRARRELVKEFAEVTEGHAFRIFQSSDFFKYATGKQKGKEKEIDTKTMDELKKAESSIYGGFYRENIDNDLIRERFRMKRRLEQELREVLLTEKRMEKLYEEGEALEEEINRINIRIKTINDQDGISFGLYSPDELSRCLEIERTLNNRRLDVIQKQKILKTEIANRSFMIEDLQYNLQKNEQNQFRESDYLRTSAEDKRRDDLHSRFSQPQHGTLDR